MGHPDDGRAGGVLVSEVDVLPSTSAHVSRSSVAVRKGHDLLVIFVGVIFPCFLPVHDVIVT